MKNKGKSKILISQATDFLILLLSFSIVIGGANLFISILFPNEVEKAEITVTTEVLDKRYAEMISTGEGVYDTLTKRKLGSIKTIDQKNDGEGVYLVITLDVSFIPRSRALRTKDVWFEYSAAVTEKEGA